MTIMKEKFAKFMAGRYGTDRLNQFMLIVLLVCAVINMFIRNPHSQGKGQGECALPEMWNGICEKQLEMNRDLSHRTA